MLTGLTIRSMTVGDLDFAVACTAAEEWVSEKASVHVYKIKGKPKFDDNKINYIFKTAF